MIGETFFSHFALASPAELRNSHHYANNEVLSEKGTSQ